MLSYRFKAWGEGLLMGQDSEGFPKKVATVLETSYNF